MASSSSAIGAISRYGITSKRRRRRAPARGADSPALGDIASIALPPGRSLRYDESTLFQGTVNMDQAAIAQAAERLVAARRTGTLLDGLPQSCQPQTLEDAFAIQDAT